MATSDLASGRQIGIKPVPEEITYLLLAKEFNWTPRQVREMDNKDVSAMMTMVSTYNQVSNKEMEKASKRK